MIVLRKILLCNYLYYIILFLTICITAYRLNTYDAVSLNTSKFTGFIEQIDYSEGGVSFVINDIMFYTYSDTELSLGDVVNITGTLKLYSNNTIPNTFNYNLYQRIRGINAYVEVETISIVSQNSNFLYSFKEYISKSIDGMMNGVYLKMFLLGDKSGIDKDVLSSYQTNGISHLFAISGMHIGLISTFLLNIFSKFCSKEVLRYLIVFSFLLFYMFLLIVSASVIRSVLFFLFFSLNKLFFLHVKNINLFWIVLAIVLLINPLYIFDVGFQFSFFISFSLLYVSDYLIEIQVFWKKLLVISLISFICSIPILMYNFYQINLLSIVHNLFFVPFVSTILFPLTFIDLIFPFVDYIYYILIIVLEQISLFCSGFEFLTIVLAKPTIIGFIFFTLMSYVSIVFIKKKKMFFCFLYLVVIFFYSVFTNMNNDFYIHFLDVGQGDCIHIHFDNKNILIDTGGSFNGNYSISTSEIIPYFKSMGIKKIDILILTHGDYDHAGEAISLINNFPVSLVLFNSNDYNDLELSIIDVLNNKEIEYHKVSGKQSFSINEVIFDIYSFDMDDENDSSIIVYFEFNKRNILLMGDASIETEHRLISVTDFQKVDMVKIGHHGSNTSTSKVFLETINPQVVFISVGLDNNFNHPHPVVVNRLEQMNIDIYSTSEDGSIKYNFIKNAISFTN